MRMSILFLTSIFLFSCKPKKTSVPKQLGNASNAQQSEMISRVSKKCQVAGALGLESGSWYRAYSIPQMSNRSVKILGDIHLNFTNREQIDLQYAILISENNEGIPFLMSGSKKKGTWSCNQAGNKNACEISFLHNQYEVYVVEDLTTTREEGGKVMLGSGKGVGCLSPII